MDTKQNNTTQTQSEPLGKTLKRPIKRTMLILSVAFLFVVTLLSTYASYASVSRIVKNENSDRLTDIISIVENNIDVDDLAECTATGVKSEKYVALQQYLNTFIDQVDLMYLYIVIPTEDGLINVISATSQEERDAGMEDYELLYLEEGYSKSELKRYRDCYQKQGVNCFEEKSDYGTYFTGAKILVDSNGQKFAMLCADIDIKALNGTITQMMIVIGLSVFFSVIIFSVIIAILIRKNVTGPIFSLEKSARTFAQKAESTEDVKDIEYVGPTVQTGNEMQSLAEAIQSMVDNMKKNAQKAAEALYRANEAEQINAFLEEKAHSAAKIAELSESITTLMNNMPAMTFYKDIETGKYLMCNQSFATYCHKKDPTEVIGLTDFELFDKKVAEHFVECDNIALQMDQPYVFFEDVSDAAGISKQFQTTKLKFTDTQGVLRLLGMCIDVTEMMEIKKENKMTKEAYEEAKNESITYSRIAGALSIDYIYLYYINITNDQFIEYRSGKRRSDLALQRRGEDFFGESYKDAQTVIHKDDLPVLLATFNKQNVLKTIEEHGMFTMTYRLKMDGDDYAYVNMKATKLPDDDEHIIIGVNSVDVQMKEQEELKRIHEERITYARINALAGNYICIYTVDPKTDAYTEYSVTEAYEGLGLSKTGKNFYDEVQTEASRTIYPPDLHLVLSAVTKENVMREIETDGVFDLEYRLMIEGEPIYVSLKAAMVEEKDGPQLIIGVSDIDARVKREQEYAHNLSAARRQAGSDALTGVRNKHAYNDAEEELNRRIAGKESVTFSVIIFDVNGLKRVNDTLGHAAGDEHLRKACSIICDVFAHSPVYRIGGDEFVVIAEGADYENVDALLSQLDMINAVNASTGDVTVACGMARFEHDKDVAAVFKRADVLMYEHKRKKGIAR